VCAPGKGGLNEIDHKFASLEVPDANGFRGLTCAGEISCIGPTQTFDISEMFPRDGAKPQRREMSGGQATFKDLDGDVVAFISRPEDNAGLHSVINTGGAGSYRVPPQCLVVFKRYHSAGTWEVETASGAVRPDCGCFEVHITYVIPKDGHLHDETVTGDKFVPSVTSLTFGDRKLYARGRKEIENQPLPLSLREEWQRDDTWTDRGGMSFSAAAELAYVLGVAGVQPSGGGFRHTVCLRTFAGVRDAEHVGDTLADFLSKANEHVTRAAETMGMAPGLTQCPTTSRVHCSVRPAWTSLTAHRRVLHRHAARRSAPSAQRGRGARDPAVHGPRLRGHQLLPARDVHTERGDAHEVRVLARSDVRDDCTCPLLGGP
jgi:hypothetical protein